MGWLNVEWRAGSCQRQRFLMIEVEWLYFRLHKIFLYQIHSLRYKVYIMLGIGDSKLWNLPTWLGNVRRAFAVNLSTCINFFTFIYLIRIIFKLDSIPTWGYEISFDFSLLVSRYGWLISCSTVCILFVSFKFFFGYHKMITNLVFMYRRYDFYYLVTWLKHIYPISNCYKVC